MQSLEFMWYFLIKRIPTDVVCTVILFLLDLSFLNKDILFLSLFFDAYDCTLHYLECCPLYIYYRIPRHSHIFLYGAVFKLSCIH